MEAKTESILILAKTYPNPSAKYSETSCVAGINSEGQMRRLFPVPFRQLRNDQRFRKWQWIEAKIARADADHRLESHKIYIDTLKCLHWIKSDSNWTERRRWIEHIPNYRYPDALEEARIKHGVTIAQLTPKQLISLEIKAQKEKEWTQEERDKLLKQHVQANLFSDPALAYQDIRMLKKLPYQFYFRYTCDSPEGEKQYISMVTDWEVGVLYWNCLQRYGKSWESPFRDKLEREMANKDLRLLMGTVHRFPDQWLIIGLIYPPKLQQTQEDTTLPLF